MERDYPEGHGGLDPLRERIFGNTYWTNQLFCVPMISHIEGNLFVGGVREGAKLPHQIKHVISLYPRERYTVEHQLDSVLEVTVEDAHVSDIEYMLDALSSWVVTCIKNVPTVVHCHAGLNRSMITAAVALMKFGRSASDTIRLLRERRSQHVLCNPTYERWLLDLDRV